jgi:hypothetical protein
MPEPFSGKIGIFFHAYDSKPPFIAASVFLGDRGVYGERMVAPRPKPPERRFP